ncbi:hypothetical protein SASPL_127356 [Salvia splendens]|uniref:Uncharacterized protein n=1 Tax=Salvia splendens TaxID=180675 RepID=A0A8X8ZMI1_SALSN|nr:hypothetical protein SASPL_127356 [Salvia splendens]
MISEGVEKDSSEDNRKRVQLREVHVGDVHVPEYGSLRVSESLGKYNLSAARDGIVRNNPQILNMTVVELHKVVVDELGRNKLMVPGLDTVAKAYMANPADIAIPLAFLLISGLPKLTSYVLLSRKQRQTIKGNNSFPLFISEFGINQRGDNEADNRYISCLMAAVAVAVWALQGSYILRQGTVVLEELYGVLDFKWDAIRNPPFLDRLQVVQQINQAENGIVLGKCKNASKWEQHQDEGPIKLVGGEGTSCIRGLFKQVSSSGLHLAIQGGNGGYLCLEMNTSDSKKCLCL